MGFLLSSELAALVRAAFGSTSMLPLSSFDSVGFISIGEAALLEAVLLAIFVFTLLSALVLFGLRTGSEGFLNSGCGLSASISPVA